MTEYNPLILWPINCKSPHELGILPMDAELELAVQQIQIPF